MLPSDTYRPSAPIHACMWAELSRKLVPADKPPWIVRPSNWVGMGRTLPWTLKERFAAAGETLLQWRKLYQNMWRLGLLSRWSCFLPQTLLRISDLSLFPKASLRCLGSRLGDYARSEIEVDDLVGRAVDEKGRAKAAEIAWEEARDGGARLKGTGGGQAGAAELAWEEAWDVWDVVAGVLCRGAQKR